MTKRKQTYSSVVSCDGLPPTVAKLHTIRIYEPTFLILKKEKKCEENWDNYLRRRLGMPELRVDASQNKMQEGSRNTPEPESFANEGIDVAKDAESPVNTTAEDPSEERPSDNQTAGGGTGENAVKFTDEDDWA